MRAGAATRHLQKIVFSYDDVTVDYDLDGSGFIASGTQLPAVVDRQPGVLIVGPRTAEIIRSDGATRQHYSLLFVDMQPQLTVLWTADGLVSDPTAQATDIVFSAGKATRMFSVTVTDGYGVTRSAQAQIALTEITPVSPPQDYKKNQVQSP